jgi:hypothetical protein
MIRLLFVVLLALIALVRPTLAAWIPDGFPVDSLRASVAQKPQVAPDGQGGAYIAWIDSRSRVEEQIYGTRIAGDGSFASGWTAQGAEICVASGSNPYLFGAAPDGLGGTFFVWEDYRNNSTAQGDIYIQRMKPDGTIASGWPVNGARATNSPYLDQEPTLAADGQGGAFVAWIENSSVIAVAVQHLTGGGSVAPGWPPAGVLVCGATATDPSLMADGNGGVIVAWRDYRRGGLARDSTFDIYAQRLTASGTIATGWAVSGLLLSPNAWTPFVLPDPTGGFYLVSGTPSPDAFGEQRYSVLRFTLDGTPTPGWPDGGVLVCNPSAGDRQNINAISDGFGGLLMDWFDDRSGGYDIYASRVLPNGTLAPGFPVGGLRVSNPNIGVEVLNPSGQITADGLGGAYLIWITSQSIGYPSYVLHLTGNGTVAPGWPQYGLRMASTCVQDNPQIVTDGSRGAVVAWNEADGICSRIGVFAQRYVVDGVVATTVSLVSADAATDHVTLVWYSASAQNLAATVYRRTETTAWQSFGTPTPDGPDRVRFLDRDVTPGTRYAYRLGYSDGGSDRVTAETWVDVPQQFELALAGARPNPSAGRMNVAFSLRDDSPSSLAILDVAGREVMRREVNSLGPGRHVVPLEPETRLAPGLYWLRLTQGGRSLLARAVVIR